MTSLPDLTQAQLWLTELRPLPLAVIEELRHRYEVSLTYNSTAIEGNTLTKSETQIVIEKGMTIAGKSVAEHLEVIGHKEALDFIIELGQESSVIGEREIREIHSLVMKGLGNGDNGRYRTLDVRAAGTDFVYPSHLHLHELMVDFTRWMAEPGVLHPVHFASEAHLRFVTIHPFRDGNGRVGRLLLNLLLLKAGYPIAVLPAAKRAEYIDSLEAAQSGRSRDALDRLVLEAVEVALRDTFGTALSSSELVIGASRRAEVETWLNGTA